MLTKSGVASTFRMIFGVYLQRIELARQKTKTFLNGHARRRTYFDLWLAGLLACYLVTHPVLNFHIPEEEGGLSKYYELLQQRLIVLLAYILLLRPSEIRSLEYDQSLQKKMQQVKTNASNLNTYDESNWDF
jgi:hypothetical protein